MDGNGCIEKTHNGLARLNPRFSNESPRCEWGSNSLLACLSSPTLSIPIAASSSSPALLDRRPLRALHNCFQSATMAPQQKDMRRPDLGTSLRSPDLRSFLSVLSKMNKIDTNYAIAIEQSFLTWSHRRRKARLIWAALSRRRCPWLRCS
jgi:hypothetical protein